MSLAEAILALALLGATLLGVLTVVTGSLTLSERNEQLTVATEMARAEMEAINERGYTWPPKAPSRLVFDGTGEHPTPVVRGFPPDPYPFKERNGVRYSVRVSVLDVKKAVKAIRVEVMWGDHAEVTYESYLHP